VRRLSRAEIDRILDFLGYYADLDDPLTYTRGAPIDRPKMFWIGSMMEEDSVTANEFEVFLVEYVQLDAGEVRAAIAKVVG
jgi:hypothetical protein